MPEYNTNLQFQPYVTPYAGAPTKEFDVLGQTLSNRYEENLAKMDELDMYVNKMQTLAGDQPLKQQLISDTRGIVSDIRKAGNWENARNQVREVARRIGGDAVLGKAQENYKKAQEMQDIMAKMKVQGQTPLVFGDVSNFTTVDPSTGQVRDFTPDVQKQLDYDTRRKTYFDQMEADAQAAQGGGYRQNPQTGVWEQVSSGQSVKGIFEPKIRAQAARSIGNYLTTDEGQQEFRVLTEKHGFTPQQAKNELQQRLYNTGMEKVFKQVSREQQAQMVPGQMGAGAGAGYSPFDQTVTVKTEVTPEGKAKEFRNTISSAFDTSVPIEQRKNQQYELTTKLEHMAKTGDADAKKYATQYLSLINDVKNTYKGKADDVMNIITNGKIDDVIANTPVFGEKLNKLYQNFAGLKGESTNHPLLGFDTHFENQWEAVKPDRQIPMVKPDLSKLTSDQRSTVKAAATDYNKEDFTFVRSDNPKVKSMDDLEGDVKIKAVSRGKLMSGLGTGLLIEDSKGNQVWTTPKSKEVTNSFLQQWGMPEQIYLNDVATGSQGLNQALTDYQLVKAGRVEPKMAQGVLKTMFDYSHILQQAMPDEPEAKNLYKTVGNKREINTENLMKLAEKYQYK